MRVVLTLIFAGLTSIAGAQPATPCNPNSGSWTIGTSTAEYWICASDGLSWLRVGGTSSGGSVAWADVTGKPTTFAPIIGGGAGDAVAGNDSRLTNARTPTAHATSHVTGGSDVLANAVAGGAAGLLSGADKTKLDATSGTNTGDQTSVSGNAGTATALQNARTINGVSFNGTANITVPAAGSTLTDTVTVAKGGTGLTALGSALQVLRTNAAANAMEWATPAAGGDTVFILAGQVATGADVNLVDITGVAFTAAAAGVYTVQITGAVNNAAATTGYGIGINCAQAPQSVWLTGTSQLANTGTVSTWSAIANNAIAGVTSGVPTNGTDVPVNGGGLIKAHATTAGTCTFRLRSETTAVARLQAGSVFIVRKVN